MRIAYLADHMEYAPLLAQWHYAEWSDLLPWWTEADGRSELETHQERVALPTTLIALSQQGLLGSVSLLIEDLPEHRHLTPWLASLYVRPEARGQGIGGRLVDACLRDARQLKQARVYLITAGQEAYYRARGWEVAERLTYSARPAVIMQRETAIPSRDAPGRGIGLKK